MTEETPLLEILATLDRRMSTMDGRFKTVESHLADGASAGEETSRGVAKLVDLYKTLEASVTRIETLLGNYVANTQEGRQESARLRETSSKLISEVRARLKDADG